MATIQNFEVTADKFDADFTESVTYTSQTKTEYINRSTGIEIYAVVQQTSLVLPRIVCCLPKMPRRIANDHALQRNKIQSAKHNVGLFKKMAATSCFGSH